MERFGYWDTSTILKLYVQEDDSDDFERLASLRQPVHSSVIASIEIFCAFHRLEAHGRLRRGSAELLCRRFRGALGSGGIVLFPFGDDVMAEAERLAKMGFRQHEPVLIRSLDLIHVASASLLGASVIVSTDERLRRLARIAGIGLLPEK